MASEVSMVSPRGGVGVFAAGEGAGLMDVEGAELVGGEMGIGADCSPRIIFLPISICSRCFRRAVSRRTS